MGAKSVFFSPSMNMPRSGKPGFFGSSSQRDGAGGFMPAPSNHLSVTAGRGPRAGKRKVTSAVRGEITSVTSLTFASTELGAPSSSDQNGPSSVWQAQSPSMPLPKLHQPRQRSGSSVELYG